MIKESENIELGSEVESSQGGDLPKIRSVKWNPQFIPATFNRVARRSNYPLKRDVFLGAVLVLAGYFFIFSIYSFSLSARLDANLWLPTALWSAITFLLLVSVFLVSSHYKTLHLIHTNKSHALLLLLMTITTLASALFTGQSASTVGSYTLFSAALLLSYNLPDCQTPAVFAFNVCFSVVFEILLNVLANNWESSPNSVVFRSVYHLIMHVVGMFLCLRLKNLHCQIFLKVCSAVRGAQEENRQKALKKLMIKSVMPPSIASKVLKEEGESEVNQKDIKRFRNFIMQQMDNVSILYADIVGFTKMSSNKTAAELVGLLNDLFGRFDQLCEETGCEKISTLGDCYYCVAGCPQPKPDHAQCCVNMGLGMIEAIQQFCKDNNTSVNMRVGIHTGRVMCGIVGTKRFKFDVFSNDVSLANMMEQHGEPGMIHISESTLRCLSGNFKVENSKLKERYPAFEEKTGTTYFIVDPTQNNALNPGATVQNNENESSTVSTNEKENDDVIIASSEDNQSALPLLKSQKGENQKQDSQDSNRKQTANGGSSNQNLSAKHDQLMDYLGNSVKTSHVENPNGDMSLVKDICSDPLMKESYKYTSLLNKITLSFKDDSIEEKYLQHFIEGKDKVTQKFRWTLVQDLTVAFVIGLLQVICAYMMLYDETTANIFVWITSSLYFALMIATLLILMFFLKRNRNSRGKFQGSKQYWSFWTRQVLFMFFVTATSFVILTFFSSCSINHARLMTILLLVNCCTFSNVYLLIRGGMVTLVFVAHSVIYAVGCRDKFLKASSDINDQRGLEFVVNFMFLVALVVYFGRSLEIANRLLFYSEHQINIYNKNMQTERRGVEDLLENFIPPHVRQTMKNQTSVYSKTHRKVGVVFGSITNFNELYDEDYEGGIEFIRVLSELISDFDDLLDKEEYNQIDKIKTIGTTMMLASGLNVSDENCEEKAEEHLKQLMSYCISMQNCLDLFNKSLLNFQLVLRIGFNHGEVTAGVIGNTKRLYDIWGDTVNTASRMDSTGVPGRIQVSEESKKALEGHYNFKHIGEKFVKGKGRMETYLLVRDDEDSRKIIPNPTFDYKPF